MQKSVMEKTLEIRLRREVESRGGQALKWVSPNFAGVPDRIILLPPGRCVFVELKSPRGRLSALQRKRKRDLERLGFEVYCICSDADINEFIGEVLES